MTNEEKIANSGSLPKWPQMYTTGKPVTVDQAKEIIRRTDTFFTGYGGNDHEFVSRAKAMFKFVEYVDLERYSYEEYRAYIDTWLAKWQYVETGYVHNSWISCAFVGGPHGWMSPTGEIGFTDNVGKWPSADTILSDWSLLAAAWPFLDVGVTLMSGEDCEADKKPVISFQVKDGAVTVFLPGETNVHEGHPVPHHRDDSAAMLSVILLSPAQREHGISPAWLADWAKHAASLDLPPMPKLKERR